MIKRLDGNSILVMEGDRSYNKELCDVLRDSGAQVSSVWNLQDGLKALEVGDFDVIICSYYLPDGLIHHVIDWAREHLELLPLFVAIGSGMPADKSLLERHLISCVFKRGVEHDVLVNGLQTFLFDFNKFYQSLVSMVEPRGISLELVVQTMKFDVSPLELTPEGIFISVDRSFEAGTFGLLRISLFEDEAIENFCLVGSLAGRIPGGQLFKFNESYGSTWVKLLGRIEEKQMSITGFLNKVAGR